MNELKSWADLAQRYSMVLFNKVTELNDGAVLEEWQENHYQNCEAEQARDHIETCEKKNCKKCTEYKTEYGDSPECSCEVYQWYIIELSEFDAEYLNKEFNLDIFYSDTVDNYILPVYHYGTSWRIMGLKGGYVNV